MQSRALAALTSKSGWGAIFLFVCAIVTFTEVSRLRMGTADAMGPGYFPALLGGFFVLFGLILLAEGWRKPDERVDIGQVRPVLYLLGAIVLFGVLYPLVGGAIAMAVLILVSALAEHGRSRRELVAMVLIIVAAIWLIFVVALNLQVTMLPGVLQ